MGEGLARTGRIVCLSNLLDIRGPRGHKERYTRSKGLLGEATGTTADHRRAGERKTNQATEDHVRSSGCHRCTRQGCHPGYGE